MGNLIICLSGLIETHQQMAISPLNIPLSFTALFGNLLIMRLIPKWPPFKYSFVYLQVSPRPLVRKLEIQRNILP